MQKHLKSKILRPRLGTLSYVRVEGLGACDATGLESLGDADLLGFGAQDSGSRV